MRVFLSALENGYISYQDKLEADNLKINFGLMSYYYLSKAPEKFEKIKSFTKVILIDSGAHTFQEKEKKNLNKVDWVAYTREYARWIKEHDCPQILGYFEMDIDSSIGYKKVLELRKILEKVTDKIIPIWHKNRGVEDYKQMCRSKKYPIVAITGFKNEDIKDDQYMAFLKYAWKWGKKVHCLGMTRRRVLDKVPFDFTDSSSWRIAGRYGRINIFRKGKLKALPVKGIYKNDQLEYFNLRAYMKMSDYYNQKWDWVNHDLISAWFGISHQLKKLRSFIRCLKQKKLLKSVLLPRFTLLLL